MPTNLHAPEAECLLARLQGLLDLADDAFTDESGRHFPPELLDLPQIIEELQPYLGKKANQRQFPFWKSVVAMDRARKKLGLIATLDDMVERALIIQPGPLATLSREVFADEKIFLGELTAHLEKGVASRLTYLRNYQHIFKNHGSAFYKKLLNSFPSSVRNLETDELLAYTGYLDLCDQYHTWMTKNNAALTNLFSLVVKLHHQDYFNWFERFARGDMPVVDDAIKSHKMHQATLRQARRRKGFEDRPLRSRGEESLNVPIRLGWQ